MLLFLFLACSPCPMYLVSVYDTFPFLFPACSPCPMYVVSVCHTFPFLFPACSPCPMYLVSVCHTFPFLFSASSPCPAAGCPTRTMCRTRPSPLRTVSCSHRATPSPTTRCHSPTAACKSTSHAHVFACSRVHIACSHRMFTIAPVYCFQKFL